MNNHNQLIHDFFKMNLTKSNFANISNHNLFGKWDGVHLPDVEMKSIHVKYCWKGKTELCEGVVNLPRTRLHCQVWPNWGLTAKDLISDFAATHLWIYINGKLLPKCILTLYQTVYKYRIHDYANEKNIRIFHLLWSYKWTVHIHPLHSPPFAGRASRCTPLINRVRRHLASQCFEIDDLAAIPCLSKCQKNVENGVDALVFLC